MAGRCYGNKPGSGGGQQGTSAYMLFYERIKKKDYKLVVPDGSVQELQRA